MEGPKGVDPTDEILLAIPGGPWSPFAAPGGPLGWPSGASWVPLVAPANSFWTALGVPGGPLGVPSGPLRLPAAFWGGLLAPRLSPRKQVTLMIWFFSKKMGVF